MKAGVVSDTHGNIKNLREAVDWLLSEGGADVLLHLGDDASDMREIENPLPEVKTVPGAFEDAYREPGVRNRLLLELEGVKLLLTHTPVSHDRDLPGDIKPEEVIRKASVELVLHGHSHKAAIEKRGAVTVINPGHLKDADGRGGAPTFGLLDFSARSAQIISLKEKSIVMRGVF